MLSNSTSVSTIWRHSTKNSFEPHVTVQGILSRLKKLYVRTVNIFFIPKNPLKTLTSSTKGQNASENTEGRRKPSAAELFGSRFKLNMASHPVNWMSILLIQNSDIQLSSNFISRKKAIANVNLKFTTWRLLILIDGLTMIINCKFSTF